ncbi:prepilin-type N-terminal cleavage/methylation domain-containing protein [Clostridium perfringens]|uniref:prepilin-type N-terminal cleavage/methylation domain-containing protein n=1 Tax=Clostridium perfringens TaxID=1502 RepID=UPI000D712601|nr:prepilin-type N-terminal cleavage/methylation domain-containing protein [Clostridium perfringens]MBO3323166.1 prepilin-type N-terminal cleavage/methylation domain-containing protein [Clostridium perfringens]MBO3332427.1 prepilin-type N-terminal cleavage/methylation domain-containing protein [Clostridium perfringens]MDC4245116.1 prepilin-type N-terminal cleavage/methylation domain-containing protein [Clostridium perfringens]PWW98769.1 peptidase [Clostridium perfringens]PWX00110.1 peptidase [
MFLRKQNKKKKGFTLIELIIVIAIIAILAAIAIPNFLSIQRKARVKADIASAKTIYDATSALVAEGKIIPGTVLATVTEIGTSPNSNNGVKDIQGYLQTIPKPKSIDGGVFAIEVSGSEQAPDIKVYIKSNSKNYLVYPNGKGAYDLNGDGLAAPQE